MCRSSSTSAPARTGIKLTEPATGRRPRRAGTIGKGGSVQLVLQAQELLVGLQHGSLRGRAELAVSLAHALGALAGRFHGVDELRQALRVRRLLRLLRLAVEFLDVVLQLGLRRVVALHRLRRAMDDRLDL